MEIGQNMYVLFAGFFVWLLIAPKINQPHYGDHFFAYTVALLLSLVGTSDMVLSNPVAFFFTVGGTVAFFYVLFTRTIRIIVKIGDE